MARWTNENKGIGRGNAEASRRNLIPTRSKDDPQYLKLEAGRDKYNSKQRQLRQRRQEYKEKLSDIKAEQLEIATESIESGDIPEPMQLLIDMIKEQRIALSNPDLKPNELLKEKDLMLALQKQYAVMLGAQAPSSQSVEVSKAEPEEVDAEGLSAEFEEFSKKVQ